jgi:hypothetical protein
MFRRLGLLFLVLLCGLPAAVQAQPAADSVLVPVGPLKVLDIPVDANRSFAMLRAIRVLHSAPRRNPLPPPIAAFDRLLDALDRLDRELARTGARGIALAMAGRNDDRDALRDTLGALGLRLREQRQVYTVEPQTDRANAELRALLLEFDASPAYGLGDIHGNYKDLQMFHERLWNLGLKLCPARVLCLGDYVDR